MCHGVQTRIKEVGILVANTKGPGEPAGLNMLERFCGK